MSTSPIYTLITGATSALGGEIAARLGDTRRLVLHGRDDAKLEALRARCARPDEHLLWPCDLQELGGLERAASDFLSSHSAGIEAFVHVAGIAPLQPMRRLNAAGMAAVMNVNFGAAALLCSILTRRKLNSQPLRAVVFISSIAAVRGVRGFNIYSASKGALDALARSLAVELAPETRVNSVLPGGLPRHDHTTSPDDGTAANLIQRTPLGAGRTTDIAAAVDFLLSDQARWITGQQLVVDGGFSLDATLRPTTIE